MTLTNTEIKELINSLLDCRTKLLWLISQNPINDEQRKFIEGARELLKQANQGLENFSVELPT